jgi:hypothetical protein
VSRRVYVCFYWMTSLDGECTRHEGLFRGDRGRERGGCLVSGFRVNNKKGGGGCLTDFLWAFSSSRVLEDIDRCH